MNTISVAEAAKYIGRSVKTMQRLDRCGILKPTRTLTNRRQYTIEQLDSFLGRKRHSEGKIVAYCRVSSAAQKPDLKNQRAILEQFCVGMGVANVEFIEEVGGGLNFKRKRFIEIIDGIVRNEINGLIIAHKDRLCRFGFDLIEHLCLKHECKSMILNGEKLSPEQEMVQDLMTIVRCFSSRLYGLRNYRKAIKEALVNK